MGTIWKGVGVDGQGYDWWRFVRDVIMMTEAVIA
jgi:hypothetical protein